MAQTNLLKIAVAWAEREGNIEAEIKLRKAGFSPRFAEQLIAGTYKHRIRASTIRRLHKAGVFK